jgi:surface protein
MSRMFYNAQAFDGDLSGWDTSHCVDMSSMFTYAYVFDGDLSGWDTKSVVDMSGMFFYADAFDGNLSGWDTSSVESMSYMFYHANTFTGKGLSSWRVPSVTDLYMAFYLSPNFKENLCNWGPDLNNRSVETYGMFTSTACPTESSPDLFASPPGPFCFSCVV